MKKLLSVVIGIVLSCTSFVLTACQADKVVKLSEDPSNLEEMVVTGLNQAGYDYEYDLFERSITLSKRKSDHDYEITFYDKDNFSTSNAVDACVLSCDEDSYDDSDYIEVCNDLLSALDIDDNMENILSTFNEKEGFSDTYTDSDYAYFGMYGENSSNRAKEFQLRIYDKSSVSEIAASKDKSDYIPLSADMLSDESCNGEKVVVSGTVVEVFDYDAEILGSKHIGVKCEMSDGSVVGIMYDYIDLPISFDVGAYYSFYGSVFNVSYYANGTVSLDYFQ